MLGLYQNREGYIMTYQECYCELYKIVSSYMKDYAPANEILLAVVGLMHQIRLFGEYSYREYTWKRFE